MEEKPVLPGEQPTVPWTQAEIEAAKEKCKELLTGDPLDYEILPPIKEGICGTPAPVLLRAVGTDPKVTINPPATLSCPMADVLGEWLRDTVQPEAKKLFASTVVKIQNASSYVCRNRYGGETTPLSEHALANALDVSEFVLANGERITVLDDWPKVVEVPPPPEANPNRAAEDKKEATAPKPAADGKTVKAANRPAGKPALTPAKTESAAPPSPPPVAKEPEMDREAQFVTFLHDDACRRFGTV
ncbi:MAG TPA: extensin family protein, partial [Methyloceanibacter sp.]|nr:extensin family protein [Methyloceanibacter sp.]